MKNSKLKLTFFTVFIFILVVFSHGSNTFAEDPITKYNINVAFDQTNKLLTGSEEISYTNNYGTSLKDLVIHLYPDSYNTLTSTPTIGSSDGTTLSDEQIGKISISEVKINDKAVDYVDKSQILKINLPTPLASNGKITIKLDFIVKIPLGTDRLGYKNEVYSVTNWYPIMSIYDKTTNSWDENAYNLVGESNYSEASDYDVTLTTAKDIITAATGEIVGSKITGDTKTLNITSHKTRDFVFMMSKYYKMLSTVVDGVKIRSYYIDDGNSPASAAVGKKLLDVVVDSFKFYNESYGKYPYPELAIAETYLSGGAMEYPSLIQMGKYETIPESSLLDHSSWIEDAAAHETGHQWWYVAVGNNEFKEPMMDESLNTYSTAYYFEKKYGIYNRNSLTMKVRNDLLNSETKPIASSVDSFSDWDSYQKVIYDKGPEIFEDLHKRLGDATMLKILSTYFSRYEFKNGSIAAFSDVVGEIGGSDMKAYFDTAVHSTNYYPKNLEITAGEKKHIDNLYIMDDIKSRESSKGLTLSSLLLRGMEGEKVDIVIPSKTTAVESKNITTYIASLKKNLNELFDTPVNIIKDSSINKSNLQDNLIVIGNENDNSLLKENKNNLPLKQSEYNAKFKKYTFPLNNLSGTFIMKSPKSSQRLMLVVYWLNNPVNYDLVLDNTDQYIFNYGDNQELRGQF